MKITVDGSAEIGWTVEIFAAASDAVAIWSGHPDAPTEADAVVEALTEWEHPTQSPEDRAAAEDVRLNQKRLEYAVRQAEAQAALEDAAKAAEEQRRADAFAAEDARKAADRERIAAEDAAARERNAAEVTPPAPEAA